MSHLFLLFIQITGVAKYTNGTPAEPDIPLTVTILDMNDNPPYFELHSGNITEGSKEGTVTLSTLCQPVRVLELIAVESSKQKNDKSR